MNEHPASGGTLSRYRLLSRIGHAGALFASAIPPGVVHAAPSVSIDRVLQAIEEVESGGDPLAIRDNTGDRAFYPHTAAEAIAIAQELIQLDHNIDLGVMQINRFHFDKTVRTLSFDWTQLFDADVSRQVGRKIFTEMYARIASRLGDGDIALWRTVGSYNGGEKTFTYVDNLPYQAKVVAAMGIAPPPFLWGYAERTHPFGPRAVSADKGFSLGGDSEPQPGSMSPPASSILRSAFGHIAALGLAAALLGAGVMLIGAAGTIAVLRTVSAWLSDRARSPGRGHGAAD